MHYVETALVNVKESHHMPLKSNWNYSKLDHT
jgi:hypothetical protein